MKKLFIQLICMMMVFAGLPFVSHQEVHAEEYNLYPMGCPAYEVSIANSNGTFTTSSCHNDYNSAVATMQNSGPDAVVRHVNSLSPTKVVAMNQGVAYSYPQRSGANTANIYQYADAVTNKKTTYVTYHRELSYFGTASYDGNGNGFVHIVLTGFDGYIELKNVDLVPMKFVTDGLPLYLGGNDATGGNEQPFYTHIYQGFYEVVNSGGYRDLKYTCFSGWSNDSWPARWEFHVGLAPDFMKEGTLYYSCNGYDFYSDRNFTNKVGTYYNYYQFLPLRSKSNIKESTYNTFLAANGKQNGKLYNNARSFTEGQELYGVNALLTFAMACLESGYGTSNYAMQRNNLFGWSAFDSDPDQAAWFESIDKGVKEHMGINLRGYLDIQDFRYFGGQLGNKGSGLNVKYAADPYWGLKIASIAYAIDKADNGYNGKLTDCRQIALGNINTYGTSILKSPGGAKLYSSEYGATYQVNHIVTLLKEVGNYYQIQSTNLLDNGNLFSYSGKGLINYDWDNYVGYIPKDKVTVINNANVEQSGTEPTGDYVFTSSFKLDEKGLSVSGDSYRPGIYVSDTNKVTDNLYITNMKFEEIKVPLSTTTRDNDHVSYALENHDLTKLANGTYFFRFEHNYSNTPDYNESFNITSKDKLDIKVTLNEKLYTLYTEDDLVKLSVTDAPKPTPTPTPTPSPTTTPSPTPTVTPTAANRLVQGIDSFKYKDDNKTIEVKGFAFIAGVDAVETNDITQKLYLDNGTDTIGFNLTTTKVATPIFMNDGHTYSMVGYTAELDMTTVPEGNYVMRLEVLAGGMTKKAALMDQINDFYPPQITSTDNLSVRFLKNSLYSYRYEVIVEKNELDFSVINKPTLRNSGFGMDSFVLSEGKMKVSGQAWMYNVNFSATTSPKQALVLIDKDGKAIRYAMTNQKCAIDYTKLLKTKFNWDNICYQIEGDISTLDVGTYRIYLEVSADGRKDLYRAANNFGTTIKPMTYNNRTYEIQTESDTEYMNLIIK